MGTQQWETVEGTTQKHTGARLKKAGVRFRDLRIVSYGGLPPKRGTAEFMGR
jgi:hypothetical protein